MHAKVNTVGLGRFARLDFLPLGGLPSVGARFVADHLVIGSAGPMRGGEFAVNRHARVDLAAGLKLNRINVEAITDLAFEMAAFGNGGEDIENKSGFARIVWRRKGVEIGEIGEWVPGDVFAVDVVAGYGVHCQDSKKR